MSIKSVASKVKKAATSYAKNVAGGAKIVASAIAKDFGKTASTPLANYSSPTVVPRSGIAPVVNPVGVPKPGSVATFVSPPRIGVSSPATLQAAGIYSQPSSTSRSSSGSSSSFSTSSFSPTTLSSGQFAGISAPLGSTSGITSTQVSGTPRTPTTNVVNTGTLGTANSKIAFPELAITDASQSIPVSVVSAGDTEESVQAGKGKRNEDYLADLLKDFDDRDTGAEIDKKLQRELQIKQKQQLVSDLTGQLNGIVAKGEAQQLSLIGQGRGIPEAIIGGQQAQIGRETAIAALPIQAQLSAAQGNLEMANDSLDRLFKIYSEDAKNEFDYKREVKKMVYDFANEGDKRKLEKLDKQEERAYKETQDLHTEQNMYAKLAFETGQSGLGAKIAKLDYKSPTFKQDLASLSSQIVDKKRDLEIQKLQQDLANSGTYINPKILTTTQFKAAQAAQNLKLTLEKAKAAVATFGNYEKLSGRGAGILNSLKVQLRSEISTALEQGVVVPGEAAAFDQIAGQLNSSFFGIPNVRNSVTLAGLTSLSSSMDGRIALQKSALTNTYKVTPEQVDTLLNITDLSDQEFADMDALVE